MIFCLRKSGTWVVVTVDGDEIGRYLLAEDREIQIGDGGNRLIIRDRFADMIEADCPDQICVNQKAIHYRGETIVCLPHRVVVSIEGGETSGPDAVAR